MENKNPCQVKACFQKILASDSLNRNDAAMFQNYLLRFLDPKLEKEFRQNGAPSGLEKRGLDASIYHKTKKPTEGTQ
ncbi:hypothetical protein [Leptospira borgpetersenii]|uniref:hypothetical protein n=1 Tax=Leptospira borgpetersenii TaxID=174 RepID=UPI00077387D5|nr:hypothetical protein [Leptospira borgpetersenii]